MLNEVKHLDDDTMYFFVMRRGPWSFVQHDMEFL